MFDTIFQYDQDIFWNNTIHGLKERVIIYNICKFKKHTRWEHLAPALADLGYFGLTELDTNSASAKTGLPVKTAPIENGPSPTRPQYSVKTAPYLKIVGQNGPKQKS